MDILKSTEFGGKLRNSEALRTLTAMATATNSDLLFNELVDNIVKEGSILGSIFGSI